MQTRVNIGLKLEVRGADGATTFYGEPVVYDSWSELLFKTFHERMRPGCFDRSLATGRDVICTVNHDPQLILGRLSAGTLKLIPSQRSLACEVSAPDTTYARDLAASLKRGDVRGMSFTFDDEEVDWGEYQGRRSRDVVQAILHEVAFVSMPAYDATTAGVRALGNGPDGSGWLSVEQMKEMEKMVLGPVSGA